MPAHLKTKLFSGLLAATITTAAGAGAGTLTVLHNFTGGADGSTPYKGVTSGPNNIYYGEDFWGALNCPDSYEFSNIGCGTTYALAPNGQLTPLVTFSGAQNGAAGYANVTVVDGYVLGATEQGGANNDGTVFAVKTNGTGFVALHSFNGTDGTSPDSFVRVGPNKVLYSVAQFGGPAYNGMLASGDGVLFSLLTNGTYTPQHFFSGGADGGEPGRIFLDSHGTIYGGTTVGGSCSGSGLPTNGCGVVYSFVPSTGVFTVLYTFTGAADGYGPELGGIDAAGNLYGTAAYGGGSNAGTLFELKKSAGGYGFNVLHTFTGGADGASPYGPPSFSGGTLVGTTFYGPVTQAGSGAGTLYQYKAGVFTTLFTFDNGADGGYPEGTPILTSSGAIIGTAAFGGANQTCYLAGGFLISSYGCGVIYKYTP